MTMNSRSAKFAAFGLAAVALLVLPILLQATGSNSWVRIVDIALLYVLLALGLFATGTLVSALVTTYFLLPPFHSLKVPAALRHCDS